MRHLLPLLLVVVAVVACGGSPTMPDVLPVVAVATATPAPSALPRVTAAIDAPEPTPTNLPVPIGEPTEEPTPDPCPGMIEPATWLSPANGATVRGTVRLECSTPPAPDGCVTGIAYGRDLDGGLGSITGVAGGGPFDLDTTKYPNGPITLACYPAKLYWLAYAPPSRIDVVIDN
jgi:hypothetical protein